MSNKNNLKDKIKKPNATQAFFNSYDLEKDNNKINIKDENKDVVVNNNKIDNNIETYVNNDNVVIVNDVDDADDYFRNLASGKKVVKKKPKKVFTSFYMDTDLAIEIDKIAARGKKGDKSKLINQAIRRLLEEYEVLEKK
ncbi:CopG family ribbon-helix-helix protein [Bacillus cihuensis]|uniref:CopG family ribbon-helix-helix protein n=1 Tax=Bacillus cihuensis TaxID=1208599 RepID=UPI000414C796|nr:ribbon-helix-helix domain-containing protein [Bacillus cihuensis]